MVTMDVHDIVVGLYPSIPIADGVDVGTRVLQQHADKINMFGLDTPQVTEFNIDVRAEI